MKTQTTWKRTVRGLVLVTAVAVAAPLALTGCEEEQGPAERLGEQVDEAARDAERAIEDATD